MKYIKHYESFEMIDESVKNKLLTILISMSSFLGVKSQNMLDPNNPVGYTNPLSPVNPGGIMNPSNPNSIYYTNQNQYQDGDVKLGIDYIHEIEGELDNLMVDVKDPDLISLSKDIRKSGDIDIDDFLERYEKVIIKLGLQKEFGEITKEFKGLSRDGEFYNKYDKHVGVPNKIWRILDKLKGLQEYRSERNIAVSILVALGMITIALFTWMHYDSKRGY